MAHHAKKKSLRPAQQRRDDVALERALFRAEQPSLEASRLVFVDESGIVRGMRLSYGYAPRGERCCENAPLRVGKRTSLIGFITPECGRVLAFEGSVTADVFEDFVRYCLVPHLKAGDVVLWDNAKIHSDEAVALVEAAGAVVLALPRYSPEYNAIEHFWSKVKHFVRKARADTKQALRSALEAAVALVTRQDVAGWMEHCGYNHQPS